MNPFCPLFPSTLYTLSVRQSLAPKDFNLHCYLIDQSCFVRIKIRVTLTLEGMLEAICAQLGVERSGFGEGVVYRECQLSFPGVERPEFGQRPCRMSAPTPPPRTTLQTSVQLALARQVKILTEWVCRDTGASAGIRAAPPWRTIRCPAASQFAPPSTSSFWGNQRVGVGQWSLGLGGRWGRLPKDLFADSLANIAVPAQRRHVILGIRTT